MPPKTTLWKMDAHTKGKHLVLRNYLNAWLPIMASRDGTILFIDGFAGPGKYEGGEDGSPVIAMKAVRDHHAKDRFRAKVAFLFVDNDKDRTAHLEQHIATLEKEIKERTHSVDIITGSFDATVGGIAQSLTAAGKSLAPAFVMVDPFGVSDTPMVVISDILRHPMSEVYISVMWEHIDRFHKTKEFPPHLDALFGTTEWRTPLALSDWSDRKRGLFALYKKQLKACATDVPIHVVHFELYEGGNLVYAIFHATKSNVGCDRMKAAIWKVAPFDGMAFRPGEEGLVSLFEKDTTQLEGQLRATFGDAAWHDVDELERWIMTDATVYHKSHLRTALKAIEDGKHLEHRPEAGKKRRGKTFPCGSEVKIAAVA
jgi:three-Cys-motif partner protein